MFLQKSSILALLFQRASPSASSNYGRRPKKKWETTRPKHQTQSIMKKIKSLLSTLPLLLAAFILTPSQAQTHVYFSEDFQNGVLSSEVWNLAACTNIAQNIGPSYFISDDSRNVWGGWVYDPNGDMVTGGLTTPIDGMYELVARPVKLQQDVANIMSLNVQFGAMESSADRKFGVRVREKNGQWNTIKELDDLGTALTTTLFVEIDAEWAEKDSVEIELYFNEKHNPNNSFYFFIDDVKMAAYTPSNEFHTSIVTDPYFSLASIGEDTELDLTLRVANSGTTPIDSLRYAFSVNGTAAQIRTVVFTPSMAIMTGSAETTETINMAATSFGDNLLKVWPIAYNDQDITAASSDTVRYAFKLIEASMMTQDYIPLLECFTASWCPPCASMNRYLNPALEDLREQGMINVIKYQSYGDKYYISASDRRSVLYSDIDGYGFIPFPIYNGKENISSWSNYFNEIMATLRQKATEDHSEKAMAAIEITKAEADANTEKLELSFSVTSAFTGTASVFAAVTEKTTTGNRGSNGETQFHWVAMDMPTSGNGKSVEFEAGEQQTFTYTVDLSSTHMEEITDLEVVCFVQDRLSRKIFQSASAEVTAQHVANEGNNAIRISMYPNPAKKQVTLRGMENADITIYDLTGRTVYTVKGAEGSLDINLDPFTAGTYMVRIDQNGQTCYKKLMVTK